MESPNKIIDPRQVQRLEEIAQAAMEALELCASLGDYQTSLTKFKNRKDIFERAVQGLRQIIPIAFYAFYSVSESDYDITLEHFDSSADEDYIGETVDYLIDKGSVALAFREKRTLSVQTRDRRYNMLIHALETTTRSHGIFFCFLERKPFEMSIVDKITTIIMKSTGYALENFELYQLVDQKNAELTDKNIQLSTSEIMYRNTFENTGNPSILVDAEGRITHSNSQFLAFSGWRRDEVVNRKNISDFISAEGESGFSWLLRDAETDSADEPRYYGFVDRNQEEKTVFLKISPLCLDNQYIISLNDVTPLKEAEKQLQFQAFHDPLTMLPNRVLFQDRLRQAIKKRKRYASYDYAVIFIDIDRFKTINDTLGHGVGDQLLIQASRRISDSVREVDTVARFGGDEFLVLLDDIQEKANCDTVAGRIVKNFQSPLILDEHEIILTISLGIFISSGGQVDHVDVIRLADMSMYEAKRQGRNRIVYADEIENKKIERRLKLENQLQGGIRNDEFFVQYQPLMDLETNSLYGFETLVRWLHPELGIVPPNHFIPIAEETGLIIPLGQKILELAFRDFAGWLLRYPWAGDLCLSINLSVRQMFQEDLVESIARLAEETKMPLANLNLEITESIFIDDTDRAVQTINSLKELGVTISIDDFGTGYSSLKYLHQFPIDLVKIDRLLVRNITENSSNYSIVASMLDLCRKLKLKVMAEGIEELEELEQLKKMNCPLGQGFYFSPPRDKEVIDELLNGSGERE